MLSVIVPCLVLSEDLLEQAKKAIRSVKLPNVELILVDNGSTVGSAFLQDTADIYIRYPNKIGFGAACNAGINLSHGDYIAICSIDNEYLEETINDLALIYEEGRNHDLGVLCPSMTNKGQAKTNELFLNQT